MGNIGGRRCIRYRNVQTESGVSRRCAKYGDDMDSDSGEHAGAFGNFGRFVPNAYKGGLKDVGLGVVAGAAGVAAVRLALANLPGLSAMVPDVLKRALPTIGGALGGVVVYSMTRNKTQALVALGSGAMLNAWDLISTQFPALGTLTTYNIPGYGLLQPEYDRPGGAGLQALIDDPRPGMSELAAMSMGNDEENAP